MAKIPKDPKEAKISEKTDGDSEKTAVTFNEVAEASKKFASALAGPHIEAVEASKKLATAVEKQAYAYKIQMENMFPHVSEAVKAMQSGKSALINMAGVADPPKLTIPNYITDSGPIFPITDINTTDLEQLAVLEAQLKTQKETKASVKEIEAQSRVTGVLTKIIMVLTLISAFAAIAMLSRMIG